MTVRQIETHWGYEAHIAQSDGNSRLYHVHADRAAYEAAATLIDDFGDYAADEAAARARQSRDVGNVIHFCRWRQVGRAIAILSTDAPTGAIH